MGPSQVLCYKVSYCLGATAAGLEEKFPQVHSMVTKINYFGDKPATNRFRIVSKFYFMLIRYFDLYDQAPDFRSVSGDKLDVYFRNCDIDLERKFSERTSTEDFLTYLAHINGNSIPSVYRELEPSISFDQFYALMSWPVIGKYDISQVKFWLKQGSSRFNFYFFASSVFNCDMLRMLNSDSLFFKRIHIVFGDMDEKDYDKSALGTALYSPIVRSFMNPTDLIKFSNIVVDTKSVPENVFRALPGLVSEGVPLHYYRGIDSCLAHLNDRCTFDNTVIILRCEESDMELLQEYTEKTTLLLSLPLSKSVYKQALEGRWENVYLLSSMNLGNDSGI